jgi:hypothetical protein
MKQRGGASATSALSFKPNYAFKLTNFEGLRKVGKEKWRRPLKQDLARMSLNLLI